MNDDYTFFSKRRRVIQGAGTLVALGTLPAYLTANAADLQATLDDLHHRGGLVLYRSEDPHASAFAVTLAGAQLQTVALTDDVVRQWRDGLGGAAGASGVPILGLSSWPDYLLVSGMALDVRKRVQLEMQHVVDQPGRENWAASLALDYLKLTAEGGTVAVRDLAGKYLTGQRPKPNMRTLFSWLIA